MALRHAEDPAHEPELENKVFVISVDELGSADAADRKLIAEEAVGADEDDRS